MSSTPSDGEPVGSDQRWTGRAKVRTPSDAVSQPPPHVPTTPAARTPGGGPRKPRWRRITLVVVVVLGLVIGGVAVSGALWAKHINDIVKRTDSINKMITGNRPMKTVDSAVNILLLGSDSRDPDQPPDVPGNWRTDTVVLMHIPASHDKAYLVSFPRDLWVHVPKSSSSQYGDTMAKINAATAWGGVPLMAQTVEEYTGVRIDHLVLVDFAGFVQVTDALGGVDMNVEKTITSIHGKHRRFQKGMNHFTGAEALDYIRQRKQFADGDFARMRHQQEFLKAIVDKAASTGTVTSIGTLTSFVNSVARAVTVDQDLSLIDMGWQFRSLRGRDMTFITCPNGGTGMIGDESVVLPDPQKASSLFSSVNSDTVADWLQKNPAK